MDTPNEQKDVAAEQARAGRRRFLKRAGTIALAVPVMESMSKEGILVRSAHAQTIQIGPLDGQGSGPIGEPV